MITSIATQRLNIRNFIDSDWPYVYEYTKDEQAMKFIESGALSLSETMRFVHESIGGKPISFAIVSNELSIPIGHLTFSPFQSAHTYEMGWIIHPEHQNKGYATEAARAFLIHAFRILKVHRVISRCSTHNIPSWHVMENIGMRREAHFKHSLPYGERDWHDEFIYASLRSEWLEKLNFPYKATFKT